MLCSNTVGLKKRVAHSIFCITDYTGNYIYKNGQLQFFNTAEGYVEPDGNTWKYIYQYKDHLGNIRLSYADNDNDGKIDVVRNNADVDGDGDNAMEIREEKNYYPFGLTHKGYNGLITGRPHNYGFVGKEEQDELGLGWIDITARNYNPELGRWMNLDPLADKMRRHSPYSYAWNNPMIYIDEDGNAPVDWIKNRYGDYLWDASATSQSTTRSGWDYVGKELPNGVHEYDVLVEIDGSLYHKNTSNLFSSIGNSVNSLFGGDDDYFVEHKPYDPATENMVSEGITEGVVTIAGGYLFKGVSAVVAKTFTSAVGKSSLGIGKEFIESAIKTSGKTNQGLSNVGRALQKHAGREGTFSGIKFSHKTANEEGLKILNEIIDSDNILIKTLENGTKNIFDQTTGRGFNVSREGLFNGFRELVD